jgi:WD40 repeat protein
MEANQEKPMRKVCLILLFLLLSFPAMAQDTDALLLFARLGKGAATGIYVLNANTGEERLITDSFADAGWSPDGRVWVVDTVDGERRLRFFDAENREESSFGERLSLDDCFPSLLWSPDGGQLAYFTGGKNELVLKMLNLADGRNYQMPVEQNERPQWSPDGHYILLNAPLLSSSFRLLAADDGRELLNNLKNAVFSPDSRYLAYEDEAKAIWLYKLATGEKFELEVAEDYYPIWSPGGTYLVYLAAESLHHYDVDSGKLHKSDLGYPVKIAGWATNESSILLYADFVDYAGVGRATTLLTYDLATGKSQTVLEDTAWIGGVYRSGDWLAIRYNLTPPEDRFAPTKNLRIYNGRQHIEAELLVGDGWMSPSIARFEDERGLLIAAQDGLYRFDNQRASLEPIHLGATSYPSWTVAGDHLAFLTINEEGFYYNLNIRNAESETKSLLIQAKSQVSIIGWHGNRQRNSLLYCGIG